MTEVEGKAAMDDHARKKQKTESKTVKNREEDGRSFDEFLKKLREHVSLPEARAIVKENEQDLDSDELVFEHCADQMMYGPLEECPDCGGSLKFAVHEYACAGFISEWSRCSYTTKAAPRKNVPLRMPKDLKNKFLIEWQKEHDHKSRPVRDTKEDEKKPFSGMHVMLVGRMSRPQYQYREEIEKLGGKVSHTITEGLSCLAVTENHITSGVNSKIREARSKKIAVVRETWLKDSMAKKEPQPFEPYEFDPDKKAEVPRNPPSTAPESQPAKEEDAERSLTGEIKLSGKRSVHKDSQLDREGGHIFEYEGIIYNCSMALCDLTSGINQCATFQLVEAHGSLFLYYKRGRVATGLPLSERLDEEKTLRTALIQFTKIFEEVTGNEFEAWERHKNFTKRRMKMYPLDMGEGVDARAGGLEDQQLGIVAVHTKLDAKVAKLCKRLFSQVVYRKAMFEMKTDSLEVPAGVFSDFHLKRCEECLLEFADFLKNDKSDTRRHERKCLDLSNKWFSLVPSTGPEVINDIQKLVESAGTWESLRNISVASHIMGDMTSDTTEDLLADRFAKMNCTLTPVDKESEDFKMIQKYFEKTYEPVRYDDVQSKAVMEELFMVDSKAGPSLAEIEKLPNKVLLWCGTRTCNLIGCLAKGLLPSLFQAPAPGYMFGKGFYCSDASCKAAKYAFTSVNEPDGYLIVSIVALGDKVLELVEPTDDVGKYESEKCAIKGLGKKQPDESEHFTYRSDIKVPCGTLKPSGPENSKLDYNEYVVYDPKQVKMQFIVQVRYEDTSEEMMSS